MRWRALAVLVMSATLTVVMPLLGALARGQSVVPYLRFPPHAPPMAHAPFAWPVFAALALVVLAALLLLIRAVVRAHPGSRPRRGRFPWWGWIGVGLIGVGWLLAWTRAAPPLWRANMFTVLWLGYIVTLNGLCVRRGGRAPLASRRRWFLSLFPVSAAAWWLFEYLNQYVGNWHYAGIESPSEWAYVVQATLPFSTVLPALASTWAWLRTFPRMNALVLPPIRGSRSLAWVALVVGVLGLGGIGIWPEMLFPMLWLAPLLVLAALQMLVLGESLLAPLGRGNWSPLLQPAFAALICGFVWELWNSGSLAKWHYSIPFVQGFRLFEMPLLGYAGYLPFGVECALIMAIVARVVEGR
jgi:hypothetical protein